MFFKHLIRTSLVILIIVLIGLGIVDYLKNFDENECSMTYMREYPRLIPVFVEHENRFENYKLFLYCEGYFCQKYENFNFKESGLIPVLFITGNADSHMQVRSLASISLDKTKTKFANSKFLYFTISFNEELSALYGPVIEKQTQYARKCIDKILSLFNKVPEKYRPKKVLVIGNSMGGVVARNILVPNDDENFDLNTVHTIITKSTPHIQPVINIDSKMSQIYEKINDYWLNSSESRLKNTVLVSLYGGHRDILVRSGLSNIKQWTSKSAASIISSYTPSIPFVWRSIDHRCMAWCRELIMTVTRALFDLVDQETGQVFEDVAKRNTILKQHFEGNLFVDNFERLKIDGELVKITKKQDFFFDFNSYNTKEKKFILFDLRVIEQDFDSLFIYSNIDKTNSIILCQDFDNLFCLKPIDLMVQYGQILPPLYENKELSLKALNLNNLKSLISKYKFLVIILPVRSQKSGHQIVIRLDWYNKDDRFKSINVNSDEIQLKKYPTFSKFYLNGINNLFQVYEIEKLALDNSCDSYLLKKSSKNSPSLLSSCLMVQYYEPLAGQVVNSESIQVKSKNISIKLSINIDNYNDNNNKPYIHVIKFEPKHLVRSILNEKIDENSANLYKINFRFNFIGTLGQYIRFYAIYFPAYLTAILIFYDYSSLKNEPIESGGLFLDVYNLNLKNHILLCIILTISNFLPEIFNTDFHLLRSKNIDFFILPILFYWTGYAVLNILCVFVTLLTSIFSFIIQNVILKILPFLNSNSIGFALKALHLITVCLLGYFSGVLALCVLFYGEFLSIILNGRKKLIAQTKLLFLYFILVFNVPGLIIWAKSISNIGIRPMSYMFEDCALSTTVMCLILLILNIIKFDLKLIDNFILNSQIMSILIIINLLLSVTYSAVSLYRLQYFIILHLVIMWFRSDKVKDELSKKKQE